MQSPEVRHCCSDDTKAESLCSPHTMLPWDSWNPPCDAGFDTVLNYAFYYNTSEYEQTRTISSGLAGTWHRNEEKGKVQFEVQQQEQTLTCVTSHVESL